MENEKHIKIINGDMQMIYPENLDLITIKKALNIDLDYNGDDELLLIYLESALLTIANKMDRKYEELIDDDGNIPTPLMQAALMLIGGWYNVRESFTFAQTKETPMGVQYLLDCYRNYGEKM